MQRIELNEELRYREILKHHTGTLGSTFVGSRRKFHNTPPSASEGLLRCWMQADVTLLTGSSPHYWAIPHGLVHDYTTLTEGPMS
jgi:hypothetical protein